MKRPNVLWWLYYQYGGTLPARYRAWVLHDGTCPTWLLRVFVRGLVIVAPVVAVLFTGFLLLGHSLPLALGSIVLGLLVNLRYSWSYSVEGVDSRLAKHGYPREYGSVVRRAAYDATHAAEAERYRAAYRPGEE
ncbi:MAG TPA: DUF5313 family protein [Pseudonocardiaceae bacterium]|nr:DUF5313 family protein [Pseudonocardiaceae bacterium]